MQRIREYFIHTDDRIADQTELRPTDRARERQWRKNEDDAAPFMIHSAFPDVTSAVMSLTHIGRGDTKAPIRFGAQIS